MQLLSAARRRTVVAVVGSVSVLVLLAAPAGAAEARPTAGAGRPAGVVVTAEERDCVEVAVPRAAALAEVRARVPQRYDLVLLGPVAARMLLVFTQCTVSVDGHPERRTTAVYVAAQVLSRDGVPGGVYVLEHWVDNAELAARYRAAGLPTEFVPTLRGTETIAGDGTLAIMTWRIDERGKALSVTATAPYPLVAPITEGPARYFHDGPRGDLLLTFDNATQVAVDTGRALVEADFRQASQIVPLFLSEAFLQLRGLVRFDHFRGSWSSTLERL